MTRVLKAYEPYINNKDLDFNKIGTGEYPIPKFTQQYLQDLCKLVTPSLTQDPVLLKLDGDFIIVGDLHGSLKDLLRIFASAGSPLTNNYIFLGDYVDRGQFSIEIVTLLLALKQQRPDSIYLLRGNHEFEEMNGIYGFREQVLKDYSHELFRSFNRVFNYLPFACVLNKHTFLVHGGIARNLKSLSQIAAIPKPQPRYNGTPYYDLTLDLVWSDPSTSAKNFEPSPRGTGFVFGQDALLQFLKSTGMHRVIRAHQCVMNGVENFAKDKLLTVFSCSNYSASMANKCGIVKVINNSLKLFNFPPLRVLPRERSVFKLISMDVNRSVDNLLEAKQAEEKKASPAASPKKETPKAASPDKKDASKDVKIGMPSSSHSRRHSLNTKQFSALTSSSSSLNSNAPFIGAYSPLPSPRASPTAVPFGSSSGSRNSPTLIPFSGSSSARASPSVVPYGPTSPRGSASAFSSSGSPLPSPGARTPPRIPLPPKKI